MKLKPQSAIGWMARNQVKAFLGGSEGKRSEWREGELFPKAATMDSRGSKGKWILVKEFSTRGDHGLYASLTKMQFAIQEPTRYRLVDMATALDWWHGWMVRQMTDLDLFQSSEVGGEARALELFMQARYGESAEERRLMALWNGNGNQN